MSLNPTSAVPLLEKWEEFVRLTGSGNLEEFASWMLKKKEVLREKKVDSHGFFLDPLMKGLDLQGEYPGIPNSAGMAGYMVVRLFKSLRFYFKPILSRHNLSGLDDFFFLATLAWKDNISKKTLCKLNLTDIPTGMDVIKRLMRQELITEKENPLDKREKLMTLSEHGRSKIFQVFLDSEGVQDVLADLSDRDRLSLLKLLDHLNHFHTTRFHDPSEV